jgi:uncharacterized Zn-binding protein involved in type VI secretion
VAERDHRNDVFARSTAQLGSLSLPQVSDIGPHPLFPGMSVVRTHQDYMPHAPAGMFDLHTAVIPQNVNRVLEIVHDAEAGLANLVAATHHLYDTEQIVPDLTGDNVVINGAQQLALIDGHPITGAHPAVQGDILRRADSLGAFLQAS